MIDVEPELELDRFETDSHTFFNSEVAMARERGCVNCEDEDKSNVITVAEEG